MDDEGTRRDGFTEDEAAFLRHVRFGTLPPRVLPADLVETVDTDRVQRIDEPLDVWTWQRLVGSG